MGVGAFVWTPLLTAVKCGNAPRNPTQDRGIVFIAYYLVKHEDTHTHTPMQGTVGQGLFELRLWLSE